MAKPQANQKVPSAPPFIVFILFNVVLIVGLGFAAQYFNFEKLLKEALPAVSPLAFIGIALFVMKFTRVTTSYLVVKARGECQVPYPYLYAVKSENKNADEFNRAQRGDQNMHESYPYFLVYAGFVAFFVEEPLLTAVVIALYSLLRIGYACAYAAAANRRSPYFILSLALENILLGRILFFVLAQFGVRFLL